MKNFYALIVALFLINGAMAQWVPQNSGTTKNLNSVYFTGANTGYAVGDSGIILKTPNGGAIWEIKSSGVTSNLYSVHFPSINIGYAVGVGGIILKSSNGGENWTNQNSVFTSTLNAVYFTDVNTGYAAGGNGDSLYILKTSNGGNQWSMVYLYVSTPNPWYPSILYSIHFADDNTGYAVGTTNRFTGYDVPKQVVLKTTNGGSDWTQLNTLENGSLYSVYFTDALTGYSVGSYLMGTLTSVIRKTTDGGNSWTIQDFSEVDALYSVCFSSADTGFAVGLGGKVIKTIDGGAVWLPLVSGTYRSLNAVHFPKNDTGYISGEVGTILKTTNGGGYPVGINDYNQTANTLCISPNPTSTSITIETPTQGSLSILNPNGRQLLQQEITKPNTTIDVSTLPSGVYVVRLTGERTVQVGKFVKR
jgi:photosystem II stability/assembly factor-like uncharacterized protein